MVGISEEITGTEADDMSIDKIISKPGFVGLRNILPTNAHGAVFMENVYISPHVPYAVSTVEREITPIGGIASCHQFWKGDLTVTLEFVASVFHRVTVLICWDPNPDGLS